MTDHNVDETEGLRKDQARHVPHLPISFSLLTRIPRQDPPHRRSHKLCLVRHRQQMTHHRPQTVYTVSTLCPKLAPITSTAHTATIPKPFSAIYASVCTNQATVSVDMVKVPKTCAHMRRNFGVGVHHPLYILPDSR